MSVRPRRAIRRPARLAVGTAALLASAVLIAGCGDEGGDGPTVVTGPAGPAGSGSSADPGSGGDGGGDNGGGDGQGQGTSGASGDSTGSPTSGGGSDGGSGDTKGSDGSGGGGDGGSGDDSAPRCHTGDLKASVADDGAGAGQVQFLLVLTNTSGSTCTVYGFPGLAFLDGAGHQVSSVEPRRQGPSGSAVRLAPGGRARSGLSYANPDMTGAKTVTPASVAITPPDEETTLITAWPGDAPVAADSSSGSVPKVSSMVAY
ncbi:DUF4232 domain-containing protein [Streptomyces sp. NPDC050560]|uniref:DUF4232 domain-containing protein n=1 Tax=Streptomyces sp. NPDC050560 TaxID=3365630 RepID=UPI00379C6C4E